MADIFSRPDLFNRQTRFDMQNQPVRPEMTEAQAAGWEKHLAEVFSRVAREFIGQANNAETHARLAAELSAATATMPFFRLEVESVSTERDHASFVVRAVPNDPPHPEGDRCDFELSQTNGQGCRLMVNGFSLPAVRRVEFLMDADDLVPEVRLTMTPTAFRIAVADGRVSVVHETAEPAEEATAKAATSAASARDIIDTFLEQAQAGERNKA